jgi:ClpP class serine protease
MNNTAYDYLCNQTWAITENGFNKILAIATRMELKDLLDAKKASDEKLQNPNNSKVVGNVQQIDIIGPIVKHGDMFSEVSGARSLSGIKSEFLSALNNKDVSAILFNIDSPGGEAGGIADFADLVFNSRGKKPIVAYTDDMACSAAYWIGSSADKFVCSETATLGSIGCAAVITDTEERDEKQGIKKIKFVSSNSPNKRPDVKTEDGYNQIAAQIDKIGDIFIDKVARNRTTTTRKFSAKDVINKFNKGGVLIGEDAVNAGLADELGSFESVLESLSGQTTDEKKEITSMSKEETVDTKAVETTKATVTATAEPKVSEEPSVSLEAFATLQTKNAALEAALNDIKASMEATAAASQKIKQEALAVKADSEANKLGDRITPAQKEVFVKAYIQAANDDDSNPIDSYSRVDSLVKVYEALPKHNLKEETLVVSNPIGDSDDEAKANAAYSKMAEEFAEKLNKKVHALN